MFKESGAKTEIAADPQLPSIRVVRDFEAAPERVLAAHIDPGLFVQWIGPDASTARIEHWDCRTLGSYRYVCDRGGQPQTFRGCFAEVSENRIVQTFAREAESDSVALETISFEPLGEDRTRVRRQSLCDSFDARDAMLTSDWAAGINEGFTKLDRLLAAGAPVPDSPAARHRRFAAGFTERVEGVADWNVPAPVEGWAAVDVVRHLVTWLPGFLGAFTTVSLPAGPSVDDDPVSAWRTHADAVQELLDDPAVADGPCETPMFGEQTLAEVIDRIYSADVFMHTWDLAVATGQDTRLDAVFCGQLLDGMLPMDRVLRESGQYGPRVEVPAEAGVQAQLLGFIGRDPSWRPPHAV